LLFQIDGFPAIADHREVALAFFGSGARFLAAKPIRRHARFVRH
jgi:hypothetical protein